MNYINGAYIPGGYSNQSALQFVATPGTVINFSHTYNQSTSFQVKVAVWVDWNQNLTFETNEQAFYLQGTGSAMPGTINVPATIGAGTYRVRLRAATGGVNPMPACGNYNLGTVVDFNLNVIVDPVAPTIELLTPNPSCFTGANLGVIGSPPAQENWYWQTSATGTSLANPTTIPWTVFQNGTYYARSYNAQADTWSTASSYVVTDFPVIQSPPLPVAGQNPACAPGTDLVINGQAPAGVVYYWQGSNQSGVSTALSGSTPYTVSMTGTYYARAFETSTQCWSDPVGLTVFVGQFIPSAPVAIDSAVYMCPTVTSQLIGANATSSGVALSNVIETLQPTDYQANPTVNTNSNCPIPISVNVPIGATITSVDVEYIGLAVNNGTMNTQSSYLKCVSPGGVAEAEISYGSGNAPGAYQYSRSNLTIANQVQSTGVVDFELHAFRMSNVGTCGTTVNYIQQHSIVVRVHYEIAGQVHWFDQAVGGTEIGVGNNFEVVGSDLLTPITAGQYTFYALNKFNGCQSASRIPVHVMVSDVNVELLPINVGCNNANDGSFELGQISCGTAPFTYSVNGGTFGSIPTNLGVGQHTIIAQDVNATLSQPIYLTITEAQGPSNLEVIEALNDQATISWMANGTETSWNVVWGTGNFSPGNGTPSGTATSNNTTFELTNLDPNTQYHVFVSANCGANAVPGTWISVDVQTDCPTIIHFPYCEDFEAVNNCWKTIDVGEDLSNTAPYMGGWGIANNDDLQDSISLSGEHVMIHYSPYSNDMAEDWLIMPRAELTGSELLRFSYANLGDVVNFRVMLSTTGRMPSDFTTTILASMSAPDFGTMHDTTVLLSHTGPVYIAFVKEPGGVLGGQRGIALEDVCIENCNFPAVADAQVSVCELLGTLDLMTTIGSSNISGTWYSDDYQSAIVGSQLDLSLVDLGTSDFRYVLSSSCMSDTIISTITIASSTAAGGNGNLQACKDMEQDLFDGLVGDFELSGTWFNPIGPVLDSSIVNSGSFLGQFTYTYVVDNGICPSDTASVILNVVNCWMSVELENTNSITVSPNPSNGIFTIHGVEDVSSKFEVMDINGRVVIANRNITSDKYSFDLSNLESGVYLLKITTGLQEKHVRLVKQ